jgi:hypothetical protein
MITGRPELLLVAAVYLMTTLPEARCRFYDPSAGGDPWRDWEHVDFVFVPDAVVADLVTPPVDATLDIMSLQSMNDARIALHVERAFDLGSRYFFSQQPGPCFPQELPAAWQAVARHYWLHQIPPPLDVAAFAVERFDDTPVINDYAQAVGWRRVLVG